MKRFLTLAASVLCVAAAAQNKVQEAAERLNGAEFASCSFGVAVMYDNGERIAGLNMERKMNPASNMKAVTTGAALTALGPDYVWETMLAYSGEISRNGTLNGDLYIIGGGDPMLGSTHPDAFPLKDCYYSGWAELMEQAGIKNIKGDIIGDGSWLQGMREDPSWCYDDLGTYYGTCASGLNFYENRQSFKVSAKDKAKGEKPFIEPGFPYTPWMSWTYDCTVGDKGSGDRLYLYTSERDSTAVIRGSIGAGIEKEVHFRNNRPERALALDFKTWLEKEKGMKISGEAVGIVCESDSLSVSSMAGGLTELGSVKSPSLRTVITRTNRDSNNLFAELLFRTMGMELGEGSSAESARTAMQQVLCRQCGAPFTSKEMIVQDGSGLSQKDRVSPAYMCRFLRCMMQDQKLYGIYIDSMVKYSGRCYYKTGSFTGCRCLCGYMLPSRPGGRTIVFSIMVNNSELGTSEIDRLEKSLLDVIASVN